MSMPNINTVLNILPKRLPCVMQPLTRHDHINLLSQDIEDKIRRTVYNMVLKDGYWYVYLMDVNPNTYESDLNWYKVSDVLSDSKHSLTC